VNAPIPESGTISPPPGAGTPIRVPPLQADDAQKFLSLFEKSDVQNGILSGETAKQIFERARLPNEVLGRIWFLSDTKQRGALDATEFIIAMHLLTSYKSGALRGIPQTLPAGLYDAAARRGGNRGSFGTRPDVPPVPAIPKQFTGPQRTASPMSPTTRAQFGGQISAQTTGDWLVTPQEKAHFDTIFETVDTAKVGVITGDQAVAFFMKAQLPEEVLAQIWDLADIDADGQLTREEFAVAMYLVRIQRSGKDTLPQVLPPALIPPNMRRQAPVPAAVPIQAPAPPAPPAPVPVPRSAADDLFGLDSPPMAPAQLPQATGGSNAAFQAPGSPISRLSPQPTSSSVFKPFVPSSSFGQSLQPQQTGASAGTPTFARSPPPPADDLLGDNDPEESSKLTNETTELANLSNQIGSLAKEMGNVQVKRTSAEQGISQSSQQKRDFEARLAQARTMYEQEVANFKALEERLRTSKAETAKLQQEYALIEGSRQDLQNQYTQVATALAADQQENTSLKEKLRQANAEVAQLKPALEKARSEARQQKGLVAINKKQLATVEGERDKTQGEIDSLALETAQYTQESATPVSAAEVTSPAASTASHNTNPFFRQNTGASSEHARSPEPPTDQQKAFDSLFGQSFVGGAHGAPPTSFRADSPATSNVPTPSVSPPPGSLPGAFPANLPGAFPGLASEIPPPSQSRQLTPNFLPFNENQSVTSSTMVSPPGSRFGGPDTSDFDFPPPSNVSDAGAPSVSASSDYSRPPATTSFEGTPTRSPFEEIPEPIPAVAESTVSPTSDNQETAKDLSFDELFGSKAHKRSESQKENDFEEAFATLKQPGSEPAAAAPASEFPPIQEVHDDDDEESSDEDAPLGFDDDFTQVSPSTTKKEKQPESLDAAQLAAFPAPGSSVPQPPAPDAQPSPPKYEAATSDESSHVPPEFNGLLPERADPTAAPDAPHSVETGTGAPIIDNVPQHDDASMAATAAAATTQPKSGLDFDAAFANLDLAPAAEAEDDDDDDEEPTGQAQKNAPDFDFSFDSPSHKNTASSSIDAGHGGSSEFFSFDNAHAATAHTTASPNGADAKAGDHDWDALFAPLDGAKPATGEEPTNGSDPKAPGWALATDSGEDDLILQRLTGMGFARDDSLAALEKFDYNLDKVSLPNRFHPINQSN
jgi:epidermal growth factor receptor substrate 15